MRIKSYISEKDRYDYNIDKLCITMTLWANCSSKKSYEILAFTSGKIPIAGSLTYLKISPSGLRITTKFYYNFNRSIRKSLDAIYPLPKGQQIYEHDDNVIASYQRLKIIDDSVTISSLRKKEWSKFENNFTTFQNDWINSLNSNWNLGLSKSHISKSVGDVEINYDLLTGPSEEIVEDDRVIERFNEIISRKKDRHMISDKQSVIPMPYSGSKDTDESKPTYLVGQLRDETRLKIYTKESSKYAVVNRVERQFTNATQVRKYYGASKFNDIEDLKKIIKCLADESFTVVYEILSFLSPAKKKSEYLLLQNLLHSYSPKHAPIVTRYLKEHKRIPTGKYSGLPKNSLRWVQSVARSEKIKIFKKLKFQSKNYICVNWNWVLKAPSEERLKKP